MDKPFDEWRPLTLIDGSRVVLASDYADGTRPSLYDVSHNVVRIGADGGLLWQVRRDERGRYDFDRERLDAIRAGIDGPRNPFLEIDAGTWARTGEPYVGRGLITSLKLRLFGYVHTMPHGLPYGMHYELDIDTGIAVNVTTPSSARSW